MREFLKALWFYRPGATTRFPGKTQKEWWRNESRRDATYYLWVAIPAKLGLLVIVIYGIATGHGSEAYRFLYQVWAPLCLAALLIITPFIYGLRRSLAVFAVLGVILAATVWVLDTIF